jgi:hypothetical protein
MTPIVRCSRVVFLIFSSCGSVVALNGWIYKRTSLHGARSTDAVALLLESGADVRKDFTGNTSLHLAAQMRDKGAMRLLLEHWPDGMMATNMRADTPLHVAA